MTNSIQNKIQIRSILLSNMPMLSKSKYEFLPFFGKDFIRDLFKIFMEDPMYDVSRYCTHPAMPVINSTFFWFVK